MNNFMISLKKFITNKNTVTVIGVIVILALLFWGYTTSVESQTKPIKVPIALVTIQPRTLITNDMVELIEVPGVSVSSNVITNKNFIVGQYSDINTVIPAGSMFYQDVVISQEEIPGSEFSMLEDGYRPYALKVDIDSTYGNSIKPGDVIDIYMKAYDEFNRLMIGRIVSQVEVVAVKDSDGLDVFENTQELREPDTILIGVPEDIFIILKKTEYLSALVETFPVPYGGTPPEADITLNRNELISYIDSITGTVTDGTITDPETPVTPEAPVVPETQNLPTNPETTTGIQ